MNRWIVLAGVLLALMACSKPESDLAPAASSTTVSTEVMPKECLDASSLKAYGTHFARKYVWDQLSQVRDWSSINKQYDIQALEVLPSSEVIGSLGWHEGPSVCVQRRNDGFWARFQVPAASAWEGPFLTIDAEHGFETAYFNRVFGSACYKSEEGEHWCFGNGEIRVDQKKYKAKLMLDASEMPTYGTPVDVDGDSEFFWVFVPSQQQWQVFKDQFVTAPEHVDIDPKTFPPWRVLTPVKPLDSAPSTKAIQAASSPT